MRDERAESREGRKAETRRRLKEREVETGRKRRAETRVEKV